MKYLYRKVETDPPGEKEVWADNLFIDESRLFVNLIISQTDYQLFLDKKGDKSLVAEGVYNYFNDVFDFIFIFTDEDSFEGVYGNNAPTKIETEGLGIDVYNANSYFNAGENLKSILFLPLVRFIQNGLILHEIAHSSSTWGIVNTGQSLRRGDGCMQTRNFI